MSGGGRAGELRLQARGEDTLIPVLVSPRAARARVGPVHDGRLKVAVTAPPVDEAANEAVAAAVARALGVPRRRVALAAGSRGKRKEVRVAGTTPAEVLARLGLGGGGA